MATASADCSTLSEDRESAPAVALSLRILSHPDMRRVGERSVLFEAAETGEVELSRSSPRFSDARGNDCGPLLTRHVSRAGPRLRRREDRSVLLSVHAGHAKFGIDGQLCKTDQVLSAQQLSAGLVLTLGRSVTLWLGDVDVEGPVIEEFVGVSSAAQTLKRRLAELARLSTPVLIVGEAGAGKRLAARLLHALGPRREEPFVALGAALLSPHTRTPTLLGSALADGTALVPDSGAGTLFLAELAALGADAQAELLHALDLRQAGAAPSACAASDARVVASTEVEPERVNGTGPLRRALIDRFPHVLRVPPLRARRQDIALLFATFLRAALAEHGAQDRLTAPDDAAGAFVPARLMSALVRSSWPGNVRQLRNFAAAFALANHAATPPEVARWCAENAAEPSASEPASAVLVPASALTDDDIRAALIATRYNISHAAKRLGVSRAWLHPRIKRSGLLPRAKDLSAEVIARALAESASDVARAAKLLCVSKHGLALRMHDLGLASTGKLTRT